MPDRVLFLLCARNGSKGILNKNLVELGGKPLIHHSLELLKKSSLHTHLVLSTDGDPIASACAHLVDHVIERPSHLAGDETGRYPVLRQALEAAEQHFSITYDYIFDFLGTAPFRSLDDIQAVYDLIQEPQTGNVITAVPSHRNPYFNMVEISDDGSPQVVKTTKEILRRQDAPETYDMNGSIYAWKRQHLINEPRLMTPKTRLHVMPEETGVDIDTPFDLKIAAFMMAELYPHQA